MKKLFPKIFVVVASSFLSFAPACLHGADAYKFLKEIPVSGNGSWDYLAVDPTTHRLYVSHGDEVVVIDLTTDKVCGQIADTPGVHGVALAPELGLGVVSIGRESKAGIVDLKTLQMLSKVSTAEGPDGYTYDPATKEAYLFCGRAQAATVVDVEGQKAVATIPLGGRPEFAAADPEANRVYDNLENKSEVAVIDAKTHTVVTNWPIAPGESASGMAIDTQHHRLFLGCHNRKMVMMDDADGKVLATVPIGEGVDACRFDPGTQLAFASCGDGTTTIAKEDGDNLTIVQTLKTERGARTMALDPTTHNIYLATVQFEAPVTTNSSTNSAPERPRRERPRMVPGTFKILVYGMDKP